MQAIVLDVGYRPLQMVDWQKAIVWVMEKTVEVVDEHPDLYINTVNWSVKMPSVVRFISPKSRKRAVKFSRYAIYQRDKKQCQYCSWPVSRDRFTYDHVTPRAQGGTTCWENIVVCCIPCNQRKGNKTPAQAGMRLLSVPRRPKPKELSLDPPEMYFRDGMPDSWRTWLRDAQYWRGELEQG